ncbi:MAG: nucleoside-diphosphate sugar epimerase/dehydratase [Thermodesulfobacteriota bacterium]
MRNIIRSKNFYFILVLDSGLIIAAYFLAYLLRFEGKIPFKEWVNFKSTIAYILLFKLFIFIGFGLYKGMWRYTSLVDFFNVLKATIFSSSVIIMAILFINRFQGFPRSVFILDWILTFIFITGIRVAIRIFLSENERDFQMLFGKSLSPKREAKARSRRLLIIGAGDAGEKMLREIRDNRRLNYEVVGFLDDNSRKKGMKIHGVPVLGPIPEIAEITSRHNIEEILIAIPSASAKQMREIIENCEPTGLKFRTTPAIGELINGRISFSTIREVSFEDLLGRDPVNLNMKSIGNYLADKVIFVSGAGGSIGSELCRQIVPFGPKKLILVDKTENSLFDLEMEFRQRFPDVFITPILGNVKHKDYLDKLFAAYKPQVVFHAGAFKHVPIVELNPWEAVFNNIVGTKNIVEASRQFGAERFILISTDKAVRPSSVMGATKRVAEMISSCYDCCNPTRFVSVRFGNVIGSEGSVIHLFKKQIERFGPVTVTHPEISRYFMTIPEASKLILQAGALGEGGEIFILDMGTPIRISKMARDLIRLSGFRPDADIEIKFIGLRPGEKLYEELITQGEGIVRTDYEKIFVLKGNGCDRNWLNQKIEELVKLAHEQDGAGIKSKLKEIVPEYQPFDMSLCAPPQPTMRRAPKNPNLRL